MEFEKVAALVQENMKTIFAYALSRVSNRNDAEDLAGEIILAILQSAPRIRDDNAFFGYIWAIAANTYKKFLRKRSRVHIEELDENVPSREDFVEEMENLQELNALYRELSLLSREYRECTIAYYFDGLSCAETASRLHISLEMVKYYLFKTRKILKEGIVMEREFGTRSYKTADFRFHTIYAGQVNWEYHNLFTRKLPGNILDCVYYTPMTIRELAIELGVAAAYLEDEIGLLEKYHLIRALSGGKYQTNLVVFTKDFRNEFNRTVEEFLTEDVGAILSSMRAKLSELRELGFIGSALEENRLLWALLFVVIRKAAEHLDTGRKDEIYRGAAGINYGTEYDINDENDPYGHRSFAGYSLVVEGYSATYAEFGVLPEGNRFLTHLEELRKNVAAMAAGEMETTVPIVNRSQMESVEHILQQEIQDFGKVYDKLYRYAVKIMRTHAPESVSELVDNVVANVLLFETVGVMGFCAVKSGELTIPGDDVPTAVIIVRE